MNLSLKLQSENKTVANYSVLVLHDVITTYNAVLSYTEMTASQPLSFSLCMVYTNTDKSVLVLLWIRDGFIVDLGKIHEVAALVSLLLRSSPPKIKSEPPNLPVIYLR